VTKLPGVQVGSGDNKGKPDHDNFVIQDGRACRARGHSRKIGNDRQLPVSGRAMACAPLTLPA
jgi:hypothetical protein